MHLFRRPVATRGWLHAIGLIVMLGLCAPAVHARDVYTLAVVPQFAPITVHRNWQPLITALSDETGIKIKLRVYNSFNRFLGALDRGVPDFAYLAPYHLVQARRSQNYIPL